jgi:dodecin
MAKKQSGESVYRIVDVVGVSEKSWEDAGRRAIETAATSLRDLRVAEVTQMDMKVEDGRVDARASLRVWERRRDSTPPLRPPRVDAGFPPARSPSEP